MAWIFINMPNGPFACIAITSRPAVCREPGESGTDEIVIVDETQAAWPKGEMRTAFTRRRGEGAH